MLKKKTNILNSTDVISAFITKVNNAITSDHEYIEVPKTKIIQEILNILKNNNFIGEYNLNEEGNLIVNLKYEKKYRISNLSRESKPSLRLYYNYKNIKKVRNGFGIGIYSTSSGFLTDKECRYKKVGGEYICSVY